MEKRSRLVLVGLAIVVAAFLYLVYVAGSSLRAPSARTMEAGFEQTYLAQGRRRVERGDLSLRKPGRMRWEYTNPAGKLFIADGHHVPLLALGNYLDLAGTDRTILVTDAISAAPITPSPSPYARTLSPWIRSCTMIVPAPSAAVASSTEAGGSNASV